MIQHCAAAQDGHSRGEQAVYDALWDVGVPESGDSRLATLGLGALEKITRLHLTNVRTNLRSLEKKLAIEVVQQENSHSHQGKTYRVFPGAAILRKRQAAGLEWVIRTKGVAFVAAPQKRTR